MIFELESGVMIRSVLYCFMIGLLIACLPGNTQESRVTEEIIAFEQKRLLQFPKWKSRGFHAPDDLPYPRPDDIVEGPGGSVWIATWGGGVASMHDGIKTKVYDLQEGLLSNHTRKLAVDRFGGIWVCTTKGMNYIQPDGAIHSYTQEDFPGSVNANSLSVAIDDEGTVWVGAYNFQLFTIPLKESPGPDEFPYQGGSVYPLGINEDGGIEDLAIDEDGNLWMGVNSYGVVELTKEGHVNTWTEPLIGNRVPETPVIYDITLHPKNGIFAAVDTKIFHISEEGANQIRDTSSAIHAVHYLDGFLLFGGRGLYSLYLGSDYSGLNPQLPIHSIPLDESGLDYSVDSIAQMSGGSIWVGTRSGAYRFSPTRWQTEPIIEGYDVLQEVFKNHNRHIIVSYAKGNITVPELQNYQRLGNVLHPDNNPAISHFDIPQKNEVFYIMMDNIPNDGAAGYDPQKNGVYEVRLTSPIQVKKLPHVPGEHYYQYDIANYKLYHPEEDELWLLYHAGAFRWDGEEWIRHPQLEDRKPHPFVWSMLKTEDNGYWFGGADWIEVWKDGQGELLELPESYYDNPASITDIIEHQNQIWIATKGNGLLIYKNGKWDHLTSEDGLPAEDASALFSALDGTLWVGTWSGKVVSYKDSRWIEYSTMDGITPQSVIAVYQDTLGTIWVSLYNDTASFYPDPTPPRVYIDTFTDNLIPNEQGTFSFYGDDAWGETPREELVYSWRVIDADNDRVISGWSPYAPANIVSSPRLEPGNYLFEVRAQDKSRNTSVMPATASFMVAPYFWTTPAFLVPVMASLIIAIVSLLIWYRNYQKLHVSEAKYRNLLDKDAVTMVLNWDEQGNLLYCNETAERFFGGLNKYFKQYPISEWMLPAIAKQRKEWQRAIEQCRQNPDMQISCQTQIHNRDQPHWISWFIRAVKRNAHLPLEYHAVGVDITQQVEAESALMQEKMSFEQFCDRAQVGIMRVDQDNAIQYMNPSMKALIETHTNTLPDWEEWADEDTWKSFLWMIREQDGSFNKTLRGTKMQSKEPFYALVSAMQKKDQIEMMVLDYTEQKQLQEKLAVMSRHEQEKLGRELHDGLGQLLSAAVYMSDQLHQKDSGSKKEYHALLAHLHEYLIKALEQTRLVSYGLHPIRLNQYGLRDALDDLLKSYQKIYSPSLYLYYEDDFPVQDEKEANIMYRFIREAVFNALKHAEASSISVHCIQDESARIIKIEDDGKGLPESASSKQGMGMKIMDSLAEQMGRTLQIKTQPGKGTAVSCLLPLNQFHTPDYNIIETVAL